MSGRICDKTAENDKKQFKSLPRNEKKIIKSMKHSHKVARRVYSSICTNIAEQFKIYLNSLSPDEIDENENNFSTNGNDLPSV